MAMPLMTSQLIHVLNPSEYSSRAKKNIHQSIFVDENVRGKDESSRDDVKNNSDCGDAQFKVNRDHVETSFL